MVSLKDRLVGMVVAAKNETYKLVHRVFDGSLSDAELDDALELIQRSGYTKKDFDRLVEVLKIHKEKASFSENYEDENKKREEAEASRIKLIAEIKKSRELQDEKLFELQRRCMQHDMIHRMKRDAHFEKLRLEFKFPELFGKERIEDLRNYTPLLNGSPACPYDPFAPTVEVDEETAKAEAARRGAVILEAHKLENDHVNLLIDTKLQKENRKYLERNEIPKKRKMKWPEVLTYFPQLEAIYQRVPTSGIRIDRDAA